MGLGVVTLGQATIGNFQAPVFVAPSGNAGAASATDITTGTRIMVDTASGASPVVTPGVVRDLSPVGEASANGVGTLGVTRFVDIDPDIRLRKTGLGATTLGVASVGGFQETIGEAGAGSAVTAGIIRDAPLNVGAGADPEIATLTTGTRLFVDSASGVAQTTTLGVIRNLPIGTDAGAAQTTTLGVLQRVSVASDAGAAPTVKLFRGVLGDHLFVALGETDVVSVAVGLRRRGNNPDL